MKVSLAKWSLILLCFSMAGIFRYLGLCLKSRIMRRLMRQTSILPQKAN
jgi:hypothetical protein